MGVDRLVKQHAHADEANAGKVISLRHIGNDAAARRQFDNKWREIAYRQPLHHADDAARKSRSDKSPSEVALITFKTLVARCAIAQEKGGCIQ